MAFANEKKEEFEILEELYDDSSSINKPKNPIKSYFNDKKNVEKFLSGAILTVGLAAIVLGFFQLRGDISLSRYSKLLAGNGGADTVAENDLLGLRQRDTDFDGLNDYEELYTYATSPYLKDSDSDGINDFLEVSRGSDPNCPQGQNCFAVWSDGDLGIEADTAFDQLYSGALSAAQVRQLLLANGMSQAEISQFSDEELIGAYQQIMAESLNQSAPQAAKTLTLTVDDISRLTPDEIRQLLRDQAGISADTLNQVSDQELLTLVKEILNNQSGVITAEPAGNLNLDELQNMSPAEIRRQLAAAGISQSLLDQTSDSDLLDLVREILSQ